jgi:hypothetical protein
MVFVTGDSPGLGTGCDFATVAYNAATGEEVWEARYDGPAAEGDWAQSLAVSPDGSMVFVSGDSAGLGTNTDFATVAYSASTGGEIWVARYDGPISGWDGWHLRTAVSPDGSALFVTGDSESIYDSRISSEYATVAYDTATGGAKWTARYRLPGAWPWRFSDSEPCAIDVSPDGSKVVVTGWFGEVLQPESVMVTVAYSILLPIGIDIKPDNNTNPINPRAHGVTPVALLGSEEFDVTEVDMATLRFGPGQAVPAHDLTDDWPYSDPLRDVNRDGFTDLLVHFSTQESGIQCGDEEATLTGHLMDGFPIEGTDTVRTVGCSHHFEAVEGTN